MTIWRLITHHENRDAALRWSLQNGRLAVGWGRIGALGAHKFGSEAEITDAILFQYQIAKHPLNNSKSGGFSLWNLYATMQIGDLVILRSAKSSRVVEVTGDYFFDAANTPQPNDFYNHQRPIRASSIDSNMLWQRAGKMAKDGGSIYRTLIRCEKQLSPADLSTKMPRQMTGRFASFGSLNKPLPCRKTLAIIGSKNGAKTRFYGSARASRLCIPAGCIVVGSITAGRKVFCHLSHFTWPSAKR